MRNNAEDPDLPGRIGDPDGYPMSTASAATAAATAADDDVPGRLAGCSRHRLPDAAATPAAAAAAAAADAFGRARLTN